MSATDMETIIERFNGFTQKPVNFLKVQEDVKDDLKNLVKSMYNFTKSQEDDEKTKKKLALPELIVEDFDEEQIWQQIELQNNECWDNLVWEVASGMSAKNSLVFPVEAPQEENLTSQDDMKESDEENLSEADEEQETKTKNKKKVPQKKYQKSIVDDQFFKLKEMEQFLLKEEKGDWKAGSDSDEDSLDMFDEVDSEEDEEGGGKEMMYNDFFEQNGQDKQPNFSNDNDEEMDDQSAEESINDGQEMMKEPETSKENKKKVKFALSSDDDSESGDSEVENQEDNKKQTDEKKSEFEKRQERLQQTINRLEQKTLAEAPWQLKGEIDATKRPQNSLLQEVVDFDLTTRPAPIITEQTTLTLEDIIKQRVKDKAWDDVVRKEKPVDDQLSFRKPEILDQAKSKLSLAQVYEAEYLKQKQAASGEQVQETEPESHKEIRDAMSKLFAKLDALSHYHYTPKMPQAEVKIVTNTPAISMEEVAPVATSDAALLAPEEIKKKHRGDLMSKEERTTTDKNRERRKKKQHQRKKGPVTKVTDNRNTKKSVEASDKSLKTSKAFFQQLNDDATSLLKKKKPNVKNKGQ